MKRDKTFATCYPYHYLLINSFELFQYSFVNAIFGSICGLLTTIVKLE